jgi:ribonuclease VapC
VPKQRVSEVVLDTSAVIALFQNEPGAARVATAIAAGAAISSVNLSETVAKLRDGGIPELEVRARRNGLNLDIVSFDEEAAYDAGFLRPTTRAAGLSLGDRACLALALRLGLTVLTADRPWSAVSVGVTIELIR